MSDFKPGDRVRHIKRGGEYIILGNARVQSNSPLPDMADVVIYRAHDGTLWVRPPSEINDGRFEPLPAAKEAGG